MRPISHDRRVCPVCALVHAVVGRTFPYTDSIITQRKGFWYPKMKTIRNRKLNEFWSISQKRGKYRHNTGKTGKNIRIVKTGAAFIIRLHADTAKKEWSDMQEFSEKQYQRFSGASGPELAALRESIRACAAETAGQDGQFDRETEALLKMLERPSHQEVDGIIMGLQSEIQEAEKAERPGPTVLAQTVPAEGRPQAGGKRKLRHPVVTVMLLTFFVLMVAATVIIWCGYPGVSGGDYGESAPSVPASLCESEYPTDEGYMLGIDGSFLAVYYNGKVQRALSIPVAQLSDYDRELLQSGLPLEDEAALRRAIEDYTS